MNLIGNILIVLGWIIFAIAGLWGFFLCIGIISEAAGFWGVVAAFILGPVTFAAAPFYAGFSLGDWFPLILNYGGSISATILIGIGNAISDK